MSRLREQPALLTAAQAFEVLGVSHSTGYEWIRANLIPTVDLAGHRRVRLVDLAEAVFGIPPEKLLGTTGDEAAT